MSWASNKQLGLASLTAVSPFAAFVVGILNPSDKASKNLVWLFIVFYGAVFYISDESTSDSVRYALHFQMMAEPGFTFGDLLALMYPEGGQGYQDIYQPGLTYLVSRFTDQTWIMFSSFGLVLGYVYSRNIWFLVDNVGSRRSAVILFLVIAFSANITFAHGLNGVRFWTSCHVFLFGFFYYCQKGDWRFLLVSLVTPLMHFSFTLLCGLLLTFLLFKRYGTLIYGFLLASFFVSELDLSFVRSVMEYLPFSFENRAMDYVNKADMEPGYSGLARTPPWFLRLNDQLLRLFVLLSSSYMFYRGFHRAPSIGRDVFVFGMLVYAATNLVSYVPSAGRFLAVGELLIVASFVLFLGERATKRVQLQIAGALSALLAINTALGIKFVLEYSSVYLLVGNFFVAPFVEADSSIYQFIGSLL